MANEAPRFSRRAVCASIAGGLATCHAPAWARASQAPAITLGMSAPFSGPNGAYGRQMREGIEACFGRVNAAGGVHGHKLRLVALDDGYEPQPAVANTRQLIQRENAFALMAFYGTACTSAVVPVLEQAGVPLVGTISGASTLRTPANPWLFHMRASYDDETAAIVRNLTTVGVDRVAVLYQDDGFGLAGLEGVRRALAAQGLKPVAAAPVARNSLDVATAVRTIADGKPQAVVMATLYQPSAYFITQMRREGVHPFFVALSPVGTDQLVAMLGAEQARGIQVSQVIPSPFSERVGAVRDYRLAMQAAGGRMSYYGLEGFLNARLMVSALQRCGASPTREKLVAALHTAPFDLGGYRVNFPRGSNAGSSYVEISVVGEGGHVLI